MHTYVPTRCVQNEDHFEWADYGGNGIVIRQLPTGPMNVHVSFADYPTKWRTFQVTAPDVADFKQTLKEWLDQKEPEEPRFFGNDEKRFP